MLSLFRFLSKHAFIVYFIFLEVISFIFLLQKNPFQRASFLNSADYFVASTYEAFDNITSYLNLHEENERLAAENSALKARSVRYFKKSFDNSVIIHDSTYQQEYVFYPARILSNSTSTRNNYLTLNSGEKNGIETGMGVISANGVVGIVVGASKEFCAVMSVLNKDSRISARVKKNGYFGSVIWDGSDYRYGKLIDIPNHVSLIEGDTIVTSGFSAIFPAGVPIGTVQTVAQKPGSGFLEIDISFTENYRKVGYVHVVKYLNKSERLEIQTLNTREE